MAENPVDELTKQQFGNDRKQSKPNSVNIRGSEIEDVATIFINQTLYNGWKGFSITRRLDSFSGSFSIDLHDRFREDGSPWPIKTGDSIQMYIGQDKILDGYIDSLNPSFSPTSRNVSAEGRDKTGDLVDCVPQQQGELKNINLLNLCEKICSPFGIEVQNVVEEDISKPFDIWRIKPEETAFETLERAARQRGVLLIANDFGQLRITRKGRFRSSSEIKQGFNLIGGGGNYDNKNRFSEYKVIGQTKGTDQFFGKQVTSPSAKATDKGVTRYRPTIIVSEANVDQGKAQERANWEVTMRAANSFKVSLSVQGFFQQDGRLWRINEIVKVTSGFLGLIEQDLLVRAVTFSKSDSGTITQLECTRPDAFQPKKEIEAEDDPVGNLGWEIQQGRRKALQRKQDNA